MTFQLQTDVGLDILFLTVSVTVATVSLVLQYLSQRHSMLDTEYEREQKLKNEIGSELVSIEHFPEDGQIIAVSLLRPVVNEESGWLYQIRKYLNPFGDIRGRTKLLLNVEPPSRAPTGFYAIVGWSNDSKVIAANLLNKPTSRPVMGLKIDSVDLLEVRQAIGELGEANIELSRDADDMTDSIGHFPGVLPDLNIDLNE